MSSIEVSKGGREAHGTHDYPEPLHEIERDEWDVVIVGAGPAGLMLASSLARFGGHSILVVDERSEPTVAGRADGIQPRTIEVLRNMEPLGSEFVNRSAASFERTFWNAKKDGSRGIERSKRVQSFPYSMEIQDGCTLGLQQGIIEGGFLRDMEKHGQRVHRPWAFRDFSFNGGSGEYPVSVTLEKMQPVQEATNEGGAPISVVKPTGVTKTVRAKYLVGCDGGRSKVRGRLEERHGFEMKGDWVDTLWAALDCVVETDFPDVRKIATIHSKSHGALYIFPRETNDKGEPIIRCYTQVNRLGGQKHAGDVRDIRDKVSAEMVMKAINEIAHPFHFDFKTVEWFTCYPIGQRLVSRYSLPAGTSANGVSFDGHRVFLAGDACHTHSPKAGQGMNTAIIDAQALAWRINLVEKGLADRERLLATYHAERHHTGQQLIDFDAEYSALFSGEIPRSHPELKGASEEKLQEVFFAAQRRNAGFTTGVGVTYEDNVLNRAQVTGTVTAKLEAGRRLTPAWATRFVSSTPVRIAQEVQFTAPGGFRLYVCGGDPRVTAPRLQSFARYLSTNPRAFTNRFRPRRPMAASSLKHGYYHQKPPTLNTGLKGFDVEANPFFHLLLVLKANRFALELKDVAQLNPLNAWLYADDVEAGGDRLGEEDGDESVGGLHKKWGIDERQGAVVVCRPDGYVGLVAQLGDHQTLEDYFDGFLAMTAADNASANMVVSTSSRL